MRQERLYRSKSDEGSDIDLMDLEAPDGNKAQERVKSALRRQEKEQRSIAQYAMREIARICGC